MGATEEQMQLLTDAGVTHVAYVLILFSVAFILFLCKLKICVSSVVNLNNTDILKTIVVNILLHIYGVYAFPESAHTHGPRADGFMPKLRREDSSSSYTVVNDGLSNGSSGMNGHARTRAEAQQIQDAEAFELQGLISEDDNENDSHPSLRKETDEEDELPISR